LRSAFRALGHRGFALVWTGQTVSRVGDSVYQVVIAWWVLEETGSAAVMGTVFIVTFLPVALASLAGGVVVDRLPRVPIMLVSDILRAVAVLGMAGLAAQDRIELWMVYALGLLFGVSDAFFQPAYFALVPELVPEEDLPSANALTSMSFQLGRVVGPALGGIILAAGGSTTGLFVNGLSFVVSAAFLLPLTFRRWRPAGEAAPRPRTHWQEELREGVATIARVPILWTGLTVSAVSGALLVGPFLVALPFMVAERFDQDPRVFGFLLACFPVGFILGSLWGGRQPRLRHRGRLMFGGVAVAGVMLALYGLPVPLAVLVLAALANGFGLELFGLASVITTQDLVPNERLGRVASLDQLAGWIATPIALALAGWGTGVVGATTVILVGGGAAAGLALLPLALPAIWRFD
jgi:MFS family permease